VLSNSSFFVVIHLNPIIDNGIRDYRPRWEFKIGLLVIFLKNNALKFLPNLESAPGAVLGTVSIIVSIRVITMVVFKVTVVVGVRVLARVLT